MATKQGASDKFELEVLDYIRKSNVGSKKLGVGPLSVKSNQGGNTELAKAILGFKRSDNDGGFDKLNKIGKNILDKISGLAEDSITADADTNKINLEQVRVLKELLPLVESGTKEQRKSKKELIDFIGKTEKGMLKNASFKNRLVEFTKAMLPSAAGIVAGIFSKSPVLGAVVNFGMEKLQERALRKDSLKKDNVKGLLGIFDSLVQKEEKEDNTEGPKDSNKLGSGSESDPVPVRIVEASAVAAQELAKPILSKPSTDEEGDGDLEDFLEGVRDALTQEGIDDADTLEEAVEQVRELIMKQTGGDPKKIQECLLQAVEATLEEGETLERVERAILGSEEKAREQEFQMDRQNAILERIADSTASTSIAGKDGEAGGLIGGLLGGGLKDKILQWIGIGAVGSTALTKFMGVFRMFGSIASKVFGLAKNFSPILTKVFGKIFSFPVQFVIAVLNGIKRSAQAVMKGEGLGTAIKEGIYGFANWFLGGFLEQIQDWVSNHRILDPIFRAFDNMVGSVKGFFVGIYDKAKSNFTAVMDFISNPMDGVRNMALAVQDYWESVVGQIRTLIANPREFITARVDQIRDGMKRFFYGMVPSWIPLKFIPEAIREDVKKARYGSAGDSAAAVDSKAMNAPNFADNLANEFGSPAAKAAAAASGGSSGSSSRGGRRRSKEEDSDNLSTIADRMRGMQGDPNQGTGVASKATNENDFIGRLIKREGGFVNDPNDRGGATNMGITQDTLSKHLGRKATVEEVRGLKEETAREIYDKEYLKPFGDVKDDNLKEFLLDFGAHSGTERVKGFHNEAKEKGGTEQDILERLIERRALLFKNIIKNDPTQKKYEKGWNNRLREFENKAKEARANSMYAADRQVAKADKKSSGASIASVSNKTSNTSVNNTTVSKRSPVNQDPSARFYAPSLATA